MAALGSSHALAVVADVCDRAAIAAGLAAVVRAFGRLDGLVNNVGFQFARRIELMPEAEVRTLIDLNFVSAIFSCQAAIPHLRGRRRWPHRERVFVHGTPPGRVFPPRAVLSEQSGARALLARAAAGLKNDRISVTVFSSGAAATGSVANFDPAALQEAMAHWLTKGAMFDGALQPQTVGEALAACFEFPPGAAAEFVEVRPNVPTPKMLESDWKQP